MSTQKRIVLIELGGSHVECLFAQILFLQQQHCEVHVICNRHLWPSLEGMEGIAGHQLHELEGSLKSRLKAVSRIKKYLQQHRIGYAVINTTEVSIIRDLVLALFFSRINITGLVHNARKLNSGFTLRKLVALKVKKFFVLNDALLPHIHAPRGITVGSFYAAFFPHLHMSPPPKGANECWVCVPGGMEPARRDYAALLHQIKTAGLPENMKIIFLGRFYGQQHPELAEQIAAIPQRDQLIIFPPGPLPQATFDAWLQQADIILPLLHPGIDMFPEYLATRISGAYNLAFAYRIPPMMEASFACWDDFNKHAIFYKVPELLSALKAIAADHQQLKEKREHMGADSKFSFEVQCQRYFSLVMEPVTGTKQQAGGNNT